jgi:hypothetical protein
MRSWAEPRHTLSLSTTPTAPSTTPLSSVLSTQLPTSHQHADAIEGLLAARLALHRGLTALVVSRLCLLVSALFFSLRGREVVQNPPSHSLVNHTNTAHHKAPAECCNRGDT